MERILALKLLEIIRFFVLYWFQIRMVIPIKNVQLLWVYHSQLQPNCGLKSHNHEYYHLLCVDSGRLNFTLEDEQFPLEPGDLVLVPKGCMHSFQNKDALPANYYEIKFTILSHSLSQAMLSFNPCVRGDRFACLLVEHIAKEYLNCMALKDDSAAAALSTLVFHLTSDTRLIRSGEPEVFDTTGFNPLSKKVVDFLCAHYGENVDLDLVSSQVGISKNYLCNAFKHNTGLTILDCLNAIRIRKAAELIVYSDLPLPQVAQMCGYVSASHFNRVFSRYVGLPPGQCRRAYSADLRTDKTQPRRSSDAFMYSVLAGKSISPSTINSFEKNLERTAE